MKNKYFQFFKLYAKNFNMLFNKLFFLKGAECRFQINSLLADNIDLILSVQFDILGFDPSFYFEATLGLTADPGVTVNFGNTASLELSLPTGITFTSESGVFLSQATPVPVPEPSSILLIGLGMLGLLGKSYPRKWCQK